MYEATKGCAVTAWAGCLMMALAGCGASSPTPTCDSLACGAPAAKVTTLEGTAGASGSADGTGAEARFNNPIGIASDGTNVYVADSGFARW